jgi:neutral ceramidase
MASLGAGLARVLITPPRGSYLIGYGNRFLGASRVHDELTATALALEDGSTRLTIVALDMLCLHEDVVARIRQRCAGEVLIACSHTHAGPIAFADPHSSWMRRRLVEGIVRTVASVVADAGRSLAPAELRFAVGEAGIAVNRRQRNPDGKIVLGVNPEGPVDPSLGVLQLLDPRGAVRATLVNFACHPAVLSPKNLRISAEWPGVMRREVEAATGGICLFLQGAAGDLNPKHEWGNQDLAAMERLGREVGRAVLERCERGVAPILATPLRSARQQVALPVIERPEESYRKTAGRILGVPSLFIDPLLRYAYPWRPRLVPGRDGRPEVPMEVQVFRIGDLALVAHAAETFTEIAQAIKRASPAPHTLVAGYSNGCVGYLPTARAHAEGGYEVEEAPLAYRISGTFDPGCAEVVTERSVQMVASLWGRC